MEHAPESGNVVATARRGAVRTERRLSSQSKSWSYVVALCHLCILCLAPTTLAWKQKKNPSGPTTRYFSWDISVVDFYRNCVNEPIVVVNGQYPGPTVDIYEGDRVIVNVTNSADHNITIHWHGIRQLLSGWHDGVGYITQCPIQAGDYFVYDFTVTGQRGTTLWHAHVNWVRATVHGAFITRPVVPYPFPQPDGEAVVIIGEWWNMDADQIEAAALAAGGAFPLADALTLNGWPGPEYNCSDPSDGIANFEVEQGKTYLLRIINAALNSPMYFGIANHVLTVVEADNVYVKPVSFTEGIYITTGQTVNVLVTADQAPATYIVASKAVNSLLVTDPADIPAVALPFVLMDVPTIPTTGFFHYVGAPPPPSNSIVLPDLPASNDTSYRNWFENQLKTLHPEDFPSGSDIRHLFYTVGTAVLPCDDCAVAQGGYRVRAAVNNITFYFPTIAILQAWYYQIPGVFMTNFPDTWPDPYDYTSPDSPPTPEQVAVNATRVALVTYGTIVEIVLQNNNNFAFESHPFHLHGHNFYVLGRGQGNYDATTDPANFNLYDPPSRFTVDVPERGWVAIRWFADNPGAWLFHCHLEKHTSWGMETVFIISNGDDGNTLPGPPRLNVC